MSSPRALRPVESAADILVHTSADRQLAAEHWLLSTLPDPGRDRARVEWQEHSVALLPLGTLFSAVRLPEALVLAAAGAFLEPEQLDMFLDEALGGGPVIYDPHRHHYYALVPASMPERYKAAAEDWRPLGVELLGRDTYLGVPRLDIVECDARACVSYWSVPMPSAAMLCAPLAVARLIAAGQRPGAQDPEA